MFCFGQEENDEILELYDGVLNLVTCEMGVFERSNFMTPTRASIVMLGSEYTVWISNRGYHVTNIYCFELKYILPRWKLCMLF